MPRNGSNIYFVPPGTEGFPDTTIESEKYNTYIHDVETDLNLPRPISAGGTGANDADEALANLGAEKSSQEVTNYDTHAFFPGSFYSAANATGSAVSGHAFVGWVVSSDIPADPPVNANVIVHAKDQNDTAVPSGLYVREKKANVWGPWKINAAVTPSPVPPIDPPDNTLYWDNEKGFLYIYYNDGNSKQWVMVSPQPYTAHLAVKDESVQKSGDTMTGLLVLSGDPVGDMDAVNKRYVDGGVGGLSEGKVDRAGDTMTGALTLNADPSANLHAATKQYVDGKLAQQISLTGVKQVDVQVPAGAKLARLTGVVFLTSTVTVVPHIHLSATPGVFVGTAGQYNLNGISHSTGDLNNIAGSVADATRPGMLVAASHTSQIIPFTFTGYLTLKRKTTTGYYKGFIQSSFNIVNDHFTALYTNITTLGGIGLNVLAFRFITTTGDNFDDNSFLNVEWM